jgi:hypothetical protein
MGFAALEIEREDHRRAMADKGPGQIWSNATSAR